LQHLINVPKLFSYYIYNFFYPSQLAIAQHWSVNQLSLFDFYLPLLVFIGFVLCNLLLLVYTRRSKEKFRITLFFSLWFWVGIALYMQFIPLDMTVADRWFYFPMIGFLGLIGVLFEDIKYMRQYKILLICLSVLCIFFLSIRTMVRNTNWINEKTLYLHDIKIAKQSFDIENNLGNVFFQEDNNNQALIHYKRSIALWSCSDAVNNLGYLYQSIGKLKSAEEQYQKAVKCSDDKKNYGNLILLLVHLHKFDPAEEYTKEAIRQYPNDAGLYFIFGVIEYKKGDKTDALRELTTGYQMSGDPQIVQAYAAMKQNKPVDLPL
jgi:tetratricopeptide (TPR) repeat protein